MNDFDFYSDDASVWDDMRSEWEAEMYAAQWDDDPSPYDGTYSEE
jgi:hypothetical protein